MVALLAVGATYRLAWQYGGDHEIAWNDVSPALEGVALTRPVAASFARQADLDRFLARTVFDRSSVSRPLALRGRQAVLIATGARSSGGYAIEVLGVREERARVVVSVRERTPSSARPAPATLTFPYRLIEVGAVGKPVEVEWQGRP